MAFALDTNVLVRLLVDDDPVQCASARRFIAQLEEQPVLLMLGVLLETEWVLRSRYKLDKTSIVATFAALLERIDVEFEHRPTMEEALYLWNHQLSSDFADCLFAARAAHLGSRLLTFDINAARLPRVELLS